MSDDRKPTKSNPFDPDTLSSSLAVRPTDVRARVTAERQQAASRVRTWVLGYDPGAGEDLSVAVLMERQHDGSHRVVAVRTWTRPDQRSPQDRPQLYEAVFKGWKCTACGVFVGEEKELMETCRSCDAPRPTPQS